MSAFLSFVSSCLVKTKLDETKKCVSLVWKRRKLVAGDVEILKVITFNPSYLVQSCFCMRVKKSTVHYCFNAHNEDSVGINNFWISSDFTSANS